MNNGAAPTRRLALIPAALLAAVPLVSCHRMTEEEALESAREDVRREMQPEIDRRRKEIEDLRRQIAEAKARLEARKAHTAAPSP